MKKIVLSLIAVGIIAIASNAGEIENNIDSYSKENQINAINSASRYGYDLIKYIKNPDKEVQLASVQKEPISIEYITNPDKEVQITAIEANPQAMMRILNPDKDAQMVLVKKFPWLIRYIANPSIEAQMYAVQADPNNIKSIKNPATSVRYLSKGINIRPNNYVVSDKKIALSVESGNKLKVTNLTNDFISVTSLAEYYGDKIYSQESFSIPPQGISTIALRTPDNQMIKSLDDILVYGFAAQYLLPNNSKQFSLFKTDKYKVSDIIK